MGHLNDPDKTVERWNAIWKKTVLLALGACWIWICTTNIKLDTNHDDKFTISDLNELFGAVVTAPGLLIKNQLVGTKVGTFFELTPGWSASAFSFLATGFVLWAVWLVLTDDRL